MQRIGKPTKERKKKKFKARLPSLGHRRRRALRLSRCHRLGLKRERSPAPERSSRPRGKAWLPDDGDSRKQVAGARHRNPFPVAAPSGEGSRDGRNLQGSSRTESPAWRPRTGHPPGSARCRTAAGASSLPRSLSDLRNHGKISFR